MRIGGGSKTTALTQPWFTYWSQIAQILTPIVALIGVLLVLLQVRVAKDQAIAGTKAAEAANKQAKAGTEAAETATEQTKLFQEQLGLFKKQLDDSSESMHETLVREDFARRGSVQPFCSLTMLGDPTRVDPYSVTMIFEVKMVGAGPACRLLAIQPKNNQCTGKHLGFKDALAAEESLILEPTERAGGNFKIILWFDNIFGEEYMQSWEMQFTAPRRLVLLNPPILSRRPDELDEMSYTNLRSKVWGD